MRNQDSYTIISNQTGWWWLETTKFEVWFQASFKLTGVYCNWYIRYSL